MVTRHESADVGSFIRYSPNGSIAEQKEQARTVGTTISVKNLFEVMEERKRHVASSCSSQSIYKE